MKRKNIFMVFICLCLLTSLFSSVANSKPFPLALKGETLISAKLPKFEIKVMIKMRKAGLGDKRSSTPADPNETGIYRIAPSSIVESINIVVNGNKIPVPCSVYCGCGDINTAEIKMQNNTPTLIISGGDAAGSYKIYIEFDSERVKKVIDWAGEYPKKPLSITIFNKIVIDDEY
jgi:hypothetical protein